MPQETEQQNQAPYTVYSDEGAKDFAELRFARRYATYRLPASSDIYEWATNSYIYKEPSFPAPE